MNSKSKLPEISKNAFTKAREKLGLSAKDLGGMACLSTRQIEQIESGETSSFYGAQIKITAAKKVAKLLKLSDEEAFDYGIPASVKSSDAPKAEEIKDAPTKNVETQPSPVELAQVKQEPVKKVQAKEVPLVASTPKSKSNSQKKLFLWGGVAAALAFAVINVQPLFFADKPEEITATQKEIIEPAPAATPVESVPATPAAVVPVLATPVVAAEASTACPAEEGIISYKPEGPRKAADMVYVQVKSKQVVCVSDASGKMQNKMVEPGVGASFYGKPPFKVLTGGLAQADVFFQGVKVRLTNLNYKTLVLEAAEVVAPSVDRADSQQR